MAIGTVGPSRQAEGTLRVSASPESFGAGIGRALNGLGQQLEQYEISKDMLANSVKERQDKLARFTALEKFSEFTGEVGRRVAERKRTSDPTAFDLTNQTDAEYAEMEAEFLASLPPDLQPEYKARAEAVHQSVIDDTFKFEYDSQNQYFRQTLSDSINDAATDLYEDPSELEEWSALIEEQIENSGLPAIEKDQRRREARAALQAAVLKQEAIFQASFPLGVGTTGAPADGSDVVAAGMPGPARAFLNLIAGPESGGRYNVRFNGSATGAEFDDFSDHPRVYEDIPEGFDAAGQKSSAAGRYMDTASTWDYIVKATGLPDFSPESQDRGNWWLAQDVYKRASGGRDLLKDIESGDRELLKLAKRLLRPTWEGLKNVSDDQFANALLGAKAASGTGEATPGAPGARGPLPDLALDPRFADVSLDTRLALIADGEREAARRRNAAEAAAKAQYESQLNTLFNSLNDGDAGLADIQIARERGWLTDYDDIHKAQQIVAARNNGDDLLASAYAALGQEAYPFNRSSTEQKNMWNAVYNDGGAQAVANQDANYIVDHLIPMVQRTHDIPTDAIGQLTTMSRHSDASKAQFAMDALLLLESTDPKAFADRAPEGMIGEVNRWRFRKETYPADQVLEMMRADNDPAQRQAREQLRVRGESTWKEKKVGAEEILDAMDNTWFWQSQAEAPARPLDNTAFLNDARDIYVEEFSKSADHEQAMDAMAEIMQVRWQTVDFGGGRYHMKYAPTAAGSGVVAPEGLGYDWIEPAVREQFGLEEGQPFQLVSDEQTQMEFEARLAQKGKKGEKELPPASYMIVTRDEYGNPSILKNEQNVPRRFRPDLPEKTRLEYAEEVATRTDRRRLADLETSIENDRIAQLRGYGEGPSPTMVEEAQQLRKKLNESKKPLFGALETRGREIDVGVGRLFGGLD